MTKQYFVSLTWRLLIMLFLQDSMAILGIQSLLLVIQLVNILRLLLQGHGQRTSGTWTCQNLSRFHCRPTRRNTAGTIQVRISDSVVIWCYGQQCLHKWNDVPSLLSWRFPFNQMLVFFPGVRPKYQPYGIYMLHYPLFMHRQWTLHCKLKEHKHACYLIRVGAILPSWDSSMSSIAAVPFVLPVVFMLWS